MEVERVVPKELNYDSALPLAIESRNNRRVFLPNNGQTFTSTASNIIRIEINADSMLDTAHSYLSASVQLTDAANATGTGFTGASIIKRLRIESGGVVLEDIDEYHRLYSLATQWTSSEGHLKETCAQTSVNQPQYVSGRMRTFAVAGVGANQDQANVSTDILSTTTTAPMSSDVGAPADVLLQNGSYTIGIPLLSGLLNLEGGKYLPLVMMNAGITLEIHLASGAEVMFLQGGAGNGNYQVSNVQYVGQLIDLDRSFYDRMRMVMEAQGGVLQLAGTSYRHFLNTFTANNAPAVLNIPARLKSIKSIFNTFCDSARYGANGSMGPSVDFSCPIADNQTATAQFRIGSVVYPARPISITKPATGGYPAATLGAPVGANASAMSEGYNECKKAWGKIGDTTTGGLVTHFNYLADAGSINNVDVVGRTAAGGPRAFPMFCLGYDFESFQRSALESGVNTADRSLPVILELGNVQSGNGGALTARCDTYVMFDSIFYVSLDGTVSVSV